jgi:NADH-quinone oxidoreductase subunit N
MTAADFLALAPLLAIALTALAALLAAAFRPAPALTSALTVAGLISALALLPTAANLAPQAVTPLLRVDGYALYFWALVLAAGLAVALLAQDYHAHRPGRSQELYLLLLLAVAGGMVLAAAAHFAALFLGLELISVSLFALLAYPERGRQALEAGVKYLVLSGVSSGLLLFGMALLYAELGTLAFANLGALLATADYAGRPLLFGALALAVSGLAFKLSLVPFHLWTPDVYQGAPAPVAGFLATVSKGAVFIVLLRYLQSADAAAAPPLTSLLSALAIASILAGNLLALLQDDVKRLLAYSSIAHLGYLLVALVAGGPLAVEAAGYYLAAYVVTTLGAFGAIAVIADPNAETDTQTLQTLRGLAWRRPRVAALLSLTLLSLAGIPLTMGFVGKFYLFTLGVAGHLWLLLAALILGSAIGLFYYLRLLVALYAETEAVAPAPAPITNAGAWALTLLGALLIGLGVYPGPLVELLARTAMG